MNAEFFLRLGPLADVIPLPIPPLQNVASIGDLFLSAGLAFFLFATLLRSPAEAQRALDEAREDRLLGVAGTARLRAPGTGIRPTAQGAIPASTGLSPALEETAALERPLLLGSTSTGQAAPTYAPAPGRHARRDDDDRRRSRGVGHPSSRGSGVTRTSASRSTARSRRCGSAS